MRVRYLIFIFTVFLIGIFGAQMSSAHPPNLHKEKVQEQTQTTEPTAQHEHDGQATESHHEEGAEPAEHSHEGGDHDEAGGDTGGHSHWGISPDSSPFSKKMAALGNFHPLLVHFPIALLLTAAFAQVLNIKSRDSSYDRAVILLVWCATLGAVIGGLLGWAHSGPVQPGENSIMSSHRWVGTLLLVGTPVLVWLMKRGQRTDGGIVKNTKFNIALFSFALAVAVQGFLGGALAHGGMKHLMPGMM